MTSKKQVARALVFVAPLVILFFVIRFVAMRAGDVRAREMGEGYDRHVVDLGEHRIEVICAGPNPRALAEGLGRLTLVALQRVEDRFGPTLGLRVPHRTFRLIVCRTHADFLHRAAILTGSHLVHNDGYCDIGSLEIALVDRGDFERGILHEGTHLLLGLAADGGLSRWLDEGLACYDENAFLRTTSLEVEHERWDARPALAARVHAGPPPDVRAVLRAEHEAFTGDQNSIAYRDAELLVTWLLDAAPPAQRDGFLSYVKDEIANGPRDPAAFCAAVGLDEDALTQRLIEWTGAR